MSQSFPTRHHPASTEAETLSRMLADFLIDVPYNSISQFYRIFENQVPPQRFGTSCVWQSYLLGDRIRSSLKDCQLTYLHDGRHIALTCATRSRIFLLDPYLLHKDAIELPVEDGEQSESRAYPDRKDAAGNDHPGRLLVRRDANTLKLIYSRFSPTRLHPFIARAFHLDMADQAPQDPPEGEFIKPLLYHGEQNNLSIRMVLRESRDMAELIYPISVLHRQPVQKANLLTRDNQGRFMSPTDPGHNTLLCRMSESLGCTTGELEDFVLEGVRIYERHAPKEIDYAPYKMTND